MKKLFVFGDVHSFYDLLMKALDDAAFDINNKDHIIVSCGDLCDRGEQSKEVLNFINSLDDNRKICIIGNHELLMEDMIKRGLATTSDYFNGTVATVEQLTDINDEIESALIEMRNNSYWNKYKKSWRWYYEIADYIFVHGWIPSIAQNTFGYKTYETYHPDWRDFDKHLFEEATWINGMEAWSKGLREENKTIICGHWHSSWGHCNLHHDGDEFIDRSNPNSYAKFEPFIDEGIVALDACTFYSGFVNVYTIEIDDDLFINNK